MPNDWPRLARGLETLATTPLEEGMDRVVPPYCCCWPSSVPLILHDMHCQRCGPAVQAFSIAFASRIPDSTLYRPAPRCSFTDFAEVVNEETYQCAQAYSHPFSRGTGLGIHINKLGQ
jgi:hypothetical protein